jgi:hypothetical protein
MFNNIDLETDYDYLYVYDGPNASSPLLATLTGVTTPADITATNSTGVLTLVWTTDVSNVGSWGGFEAIVMSITPLPVELLYFEGDAHSLFNNLRWSTASEHNSDYFEIQVSIDGLNWEYVGTRTAAGNSTQVQNYSYLDYFDESGIHYYRLKQIDFNGVYKMYGPISVNNLPLSTKKIVGYYTISGQEISELSTFKGMYLILYEGGDVQKCVK